MWLYCYYRVFYESVSWVKYDVILFDYCRKFILFRFIMFVYKERFYICKYIWKEKSKWEMLRKEEMKFS